MDNVIGRVDVLSNLKTASDFPELINEFDEPKQDEMHEAATDEDQEILERLNSNSSEGWDFYVSYMLDESGPDMCAALKEATKTNPDLCEIGRLFMKAYKGCEPSYLSFHREG